jgi:hypothetical protein
MICLAEEREQSTSARFVCPESKLSKRGKQSRRPRSPSSNHNVKERHIKGEFILPAMDCHPQEMPREQRGRALYGGA